MLTPCKIPSQQEYCYFIGNTPAANLLRDKAVHAGGHQRVLCLACGDVRSILYTLWMQPADPHHKIEFTICDLESAVIARNLFLLSYLIRTHSDRGKASDKDHDFVWAVYYHMFLTQQTVEEAKQHLELLLDLSASSTAWSSSIYGTALVFLSDSTRQEVRACWRRYLDHFRCDRQQSLHKSIKQHRKSLAKLKQVGLGGLRAFGAHGLGESGLIDMVIREYWRTGVVAGNKADSQALAAERGGTVNPLLAISSSPREQFALQPGSDPLMGFHLAEVLDAAAGSAIRSATQREQLASSAKTQLRSWCDAFLQYVGSEAVEIVFHAGEALALCYALQSRSGRAIGMPNHLSTYVRPFSAVPLVLGGHDDVEKNTFDVIETSNVCDHVDVLNLLPAVVPLLSVKRNSVLYTETLTQRTTATETYMVDFLRADVATVGLICGVAPIVSLVRSSGSYFAVESFLDKLGRQEGHNYHMRVRLVWKRPESGDGKASASTTVVVDDSDALADFFFKWCISTGPAQDPSRAILTTEKLIFNAKRISRITLVGLVCLAHRHIDADWPRVVANLSNRIGAELSPPGQQLPFIDELSLNLHVIGIGRGLHSKTLLTPPRDHHRSDFLSSPPIAFVVLVIPRTRLLPPILSANGPADTSALRLQVYLEGVFQDEFSAIHACFGTFKPGKGQPRTGSIREDPAGWSGKSDMVVTCMIPNYPLLTSESIALQIALAVGPGSAIDCLASLLGSGFKIFSTSLDDSERVHMLDCLPNTSRTPPESISHCRSRGLNSLEPEVRLKWTGSRVASISTRLVITKPEEQATLKSGASIHVDQTSPCTMCIGFDQYAHLLSFPYPIAAARSTVRVARKDSWIEVNAPIAFAPHKREGYGLNLFPVISDQGHLVPWSLPRINLSKLPKIPLPFPKLLTGLWQKPKGLREDDIFTEMSGWKDIMEDMLRQFSLNNQHYEGPRDAIGLAAGGHLDTLFFFSCMRHDYDHSSVCIEAYVVPLTSARHTLLREVLLGLGPIRCITNVEGLDLTTQILRIWKFLLPAMVERCRTGWEHESRCEYGRGQDFQCPRSTNILQSPICSCGEGKNVEELPPAYTELSAFATKVVLTPISAVPFLEEMSWDGMVGDAVKAHCMYIDMMADYKASMARSNGSGGPQSGTGTTGACDECGKNNHTLKVCAGCGKTRYCDRDCQRRAWKQHKKACKTPVASPSDILYRLS